jgi:hypothetical protein
MMTSEIRHTFAMWRSLSIWLWSEVQWGRDASGGLVPGVGVEPTIPMGREADFKSAAFALFATPAP